MAPTPPTNPKQRSRRSPDRSCAQHDGTPLPSSSRTAPESLRGTKRNNRSPSRNSEPAAVPKKKKQKLKPKLIGQQPEVVQQLPWELHPPGLLPLCVTPAALQPPPPEKVSLAAMAIRSHHSPDRSRVQRGGTPPPSNSRTAPKSPCGTKRNDCPPSQSAQPAAVPGKKEQKSTSEVIKRAPQAAGLKWADWEADRVSLTVSQNANGGVVRTASLRETAAAPQPEVVQQPPPMPPSSYPSRTAPKTPCETKCDNRSASRSAPPAAAPGKRKRKSKTGVINRALQAAGLKWADWEADRVALTVTRNANGELVRTASLRETAPASQLEVVQQPPPSPPPSLPYEPPPSGIPPYEVSCPPGLSPGGASPAAALPPNMVAQIAVAICQALATSQPPHS